MVKEEITEIIHKTASELGYSVYEMSIYLKGENSKINVKIDNVHAISHEDCERFSKELSYNLDNSSILPNYMLEVSSPGLNRKLRSMDELKRFIESPVKITYDKESMNETIQGTLIAVDEKDKKLAVKVKEGKNIILNIAYESIIHANLDY